MSACRSCGAPVRWATTSQGKRIPLDEEPDDAGNVTVDEAGTATVHPAGGMLTPDGDRYMPHHATCPQGREWRR